MTNHQIKINQLQETITQLKTELNQLQETITQLKTELNTLKQIVSNQPPLSAIAYPQLPNNSAPINQILAIPLSKIIDLYRECPQILEPIAIRVSLDKEHFPFESNTNDLPLNFHVSPNGNFWIIQLQGQGEYLFPRPSDFKRLTRLSNLPRIFAIKGEASDDYNEFALLKAAKLKVLSIHKNWSLENEGMIAYGRISPHYEGQKEVESIRIEFEAFKHLVNNYGDASVAFILTAERWQQALEAKYGSLMSITINTCMPIAYALYKGRILVPCQLLTSHKPIILPGWDRGIDWSTSIYSKFHSTNNKDFFETSPNHPVLPAQACFREKKQISNHIWAIADSYPDASAILEKLINNWGALN